MEQIQPRQWGHNPKPKPAPLTPAAALPDGRYLVEPAGYRKVTVRIATLPGSNWSALQIQNPTRDGWTAVAVVEPNDTIQPYTSNGPFQRAVIEALVTDPNPNRLAERYAIETGNCFVCGRELTDPVSVAQGIGPECAAKRGIDRISDQEAETRIEKRRANAVAA